MYAASAGTKSRAGADSPAQSDGREARDGVECYDRAPPMKCITAFCGSNPGARPEYGQAADALGRAIVRRGLTLVYGGASVGLMGRLADAVIARNGRVVGVIPSALRDKEIAHPGLTDMRIVGSMHERKQVMTALGDAFIALPGGLGTLDELAEALTWAQLGLHDKPCGVLEVGDFFAPLLQYLDRAVEEGFLRPVHRAMVLVERDPDRLLDRLAAFRVPNVAKWMS
jgi:uncharacterized protein (TIGR00730 family)